MSVNIMEFIDTRYISPNTLTPLTDTETTKYGYNAGLIHNGMRNTLLGFGVAQDTHGGDDNICVGWFAGRTMGVTAAQNVAIGNMACGNASGVNNVVVGHGACAVAGPGQQNVCVGALTECVGELNCVLGSGASCYGNQNVVLGSNVMVASQNTIVIGHGLDNFNNDDAIVIGNKLQSNVNIGSALSSNATHVTFPHNCLVNGQLRASVFNVSDWRIVGEPNDTGGTDLVMSARQSRICFDDVFEPGVLNFTGQHKCVCEFDPDPSLIGMLVRSTGRYMNIDGTECPTVSESIPVVALTTSKADKSVFGVVGGFGAGSSFKIGNINFHLPDIFSATRCIVNTVGEGGIWVCDEGGDLMNGDLVMSSSVPGMGCKQEDDVVRSCTVAKVTCDCHFTQTVRKMFVGCVYK